MSFKGDLSTIGLAEVFQMISMSQKVGTLVVQDAESRKCIYFGSDGVQLHSAGRRKGFRIGDMLVRAGKITAPQLQEVLEEQKSSRQMVGELLVGKGMTSAEEIDGLVRTQIEEEIYDLFLWRKARFEFIEGDPVEELQDPEIRAIRLSFDVNSLLLEAVRRTDEWTLINQKIPSMDCIYTFVSTAARDEEDASATEAARAFYQFLEGAATVSDVIEQSCVPRFEACKILIDLLDRGRVRLLTPTELTGVARRALEEGRREKGLSLFQVAVQLAPEDPDLIGKYAHALETEGMIQEAARMYVRVGSLLKTQGEGKDALAYFQRAVSLNPDDIQSKIALFEVNLMTGTVEDAISSASDLISASLREKEFESARGIAEQAVAAAPQSLEMRLALGRVYHAMGLKAERDEVVLYLRKNLPVEQGAADKILSELGELSDTPTSAPKPSRTVAPAPRKRRASRISLGRLALVVAILGVIAGGGYWGLYEIRARGALNDAVRKSEALAKEKKWAEASAVINQVRASYSMSLFSSGRVDGALAEVARRKKEDEKIPPDVAKRRELEELERQTAIRKIGSMQDTLRQQFRDGYWDLALETAKEIRAIGERYRLQGEIQEAKEILDTLALRAREAEELKARIERLMGDQNFKEACRETEKLKVQHGSWKVAKEAMFPLALFAEPAGVTVRTVSDGRVVGVAGEEPLIMKLEMRNRKFSLRFEKPGFVAAVREVSGYLAAELRVRLDEREAREAPIIGLTPLSDPMFAHGLFLAHMENDRREREVLAFRGRRVVWRKPADTAPRAGPDGRVYFAHADTLIGFEGVDDAEQKGEWKFRSAGAITTPAAFSASGTEVYFAAGRTLYALSTASILTQWSKDLPAECRIPLVIVGGNVIAACSDGVVYAVNAEEKIPWSCSLGRVPVAAPRLEGGRLYVAAGSQVTCIDAKTGRSEWTTARSELDDNIVGSPWVAEGRVFVAAEDGTVASFKEEDGTLLRKARPGGRMRAGVCVVKGRVLAGDLAGVFWWLDAADLQSRWRYQPKERGPFSTLPAFVDSLAYVVSDNRVLHILPLD